MATEIAMAIATVIATEIAIAIATVIAIAIATVIAMTIANATARATASCGVLAAPSMLPRRGVDGLHPTLPTPQLGWIRNAGIDRPIRGV